MEHTLKSILLKLYWIGIILMFQFGGAVGQSNDNVSQLLYTQFFINPAYAGIDNALSIDLSAQRQWSGIEGAPQKYILGLHSPINNTQMSFGGNMQLYKSGVSSVYQGNFAYSYLLKLSGSKLLSLGINASVSGGQTGFEKLNLNQYNDPNFSSSYNYSTQFNTGFGAFLYSRDYYLGVSVPYLMKNNNNEDFNIWNGIGDDRSLIISAGYSWNTTKTISINPKVVYNQYESDSPVWVMGAMFGYNQTIAMGGIYQSLGWGFLSCNVNVINNLQIRYTYGFSMNSNLVSRNTNEFSIGYTIESLYRFNKRRTFDVKENSEKSSVKSLRFF